MMEKHVLNREGLALKVTQQFHRDISTGPRQPADSMQGIVPPGVRCTLASAYVGLTIRSPRALMMTRWPGRLNSTIILPRRATTSCRSLASESIIFAAMNEFEVLLCLPHPCLIQEVLSRYVPSFLHTWAQSKSQAEGYDGKW